MKSGPMNFAHGRQGEVNYFPSRVNPTRQSVAHAIPHEATQGPRIKATITKEDNFRQPGDRWRSWDQGRKSRFVERLMGWLGHPRTPKDVQQVWVGYLSQCDVEMGRMVGQRVAALQQTLGVSPSPVL